MLLLKLAITNMKTMVACPWQERKLRTIHILMRHLPSSMHRISGSKVRKYIPLSGKSIGWRSDLDTLLLTCLQELLSEVDRSV